MKNKNQKEKKKDSKIKTFFQNLQDNTPKLDKKDWIIMGVLVLFYFIQKAGHELCLLLL